jgi:hypothetical protein
MTIGIAFFILTYFYTMEIPTHSESNFTLTMKTHLIGMAKLTKFISIVWFGVLFVFVLTSLNYIFPAFKDFFTTRHNPVQGILYLTITLFLALTNWKLLQFSNGILKNVPMMNNEGIEIALSRMKFMFKLYGIVIIIFLIVFLLLATKTFTLYLDSTEVH